MAIGGGVAKIIRQLKKELQKELSASTYQHLCWYLDWATDKQICSLANHLDPNFRLGRLGWEPMPPTPEPTQVPAPSVDESKHEEHNEACNDGHCRFGS